MKTGLAYAVRARLLPGTALALLIVLAAALRLYRLDTIGPGLHFDEAAYGMLALEVLSGRFPVFFSAYAAREAGFPYLVAASIALLGRTVLAVRLPAALAGVALVPVVFLIGRRALGPQGALLAAGMAAVAPWLVHLNRIGFRSNLLPLAVALWAWLLLRGLEGTTEVKEPGRQGARSQGALAPLSSSTAHRASRWWTWLAAGVALGLAAHTYLAARFVPILVALFLLYLGLAHRPQLRRSLPQIGLMLLVAGLLALPLVVHFLRVPADWGERSSQIWACAGLEVGACAARIGGNALGALGMVGVRGDPLRFFNLPGSPALPAPIGWVFYLGLAIALRRWRQPAMALLLLWWGVMVLPGVLSRDAVTYVRTSGAAAPTMLLWALPLAAAGEWLLRRRPAVRVPLAAAGGAIVLLAAGLSARDYFLRWAPLPELYYDYMGYAVDAARAAGDTAAGTSLAISEEYYRHPTYLFLSRRTDAARWFDARAGWPPVPPGGVRLIVSPATPIAPHATPLLEGAVRREVPNDAGQHAYTEILLPQTWPGPPPPGRSLADRAGVLDLTGATTLQEGGQLLLTLQWRVREPAPAPSLVVFAHLRDGDGRKLSQGDSLGFPAQEWRAGDTFASFHSIPLPPGADPAELWLAVGLYDFVRGEGAPASGPHARGDYLLLPAAG